MKKIVFITSFTAFIIVISLYVLQFRFNETNKILQNVQSIIAKHDSSGYNFEIKELPKSITNAKLGMTFSDFNELFPNTSNSTIKELGYYIAEPNPLLSENSFHFKPNLYYEINDYKQYLINEYHFLIFSEFENMDEEKKQSIINQFQLLNELERNQSLGEPLLIRIRVQGNDRIQIAELKQYIATFGVEDEKYLYISYRYDPKNTNAFLLLYWNRDTYKIFFTYHYNFERNKISAFNFYYTLPNVSVDHFMKNSKRVPVSLIKENKKYLVRISIPI